MIRNEWDGCRGLFPGGLWRVGKYLGEKTRARGWRCEVTMHYGYDVIAFDCGLFSRSQRVSFLFRLALAASDSIIAYRPYNMGDFGVCTSHVKGRNSQWQTTSRVGGWWLALLDSAVSLAYIFILYMYIHEDVLICLEVCPIAIVENYEKCIVAGECHEKHFQCLHGFVSVFGFCCHFWLWFLGFSHF